MSVKMALVMKKNAWPIYLVCIVLHITTFLHNCNPVWWVGRVTVSVPHAAMLLLFQHCQPATVTWSTFPMLPDSFQQINGCQLDRWQVNWVNLPQQHNHPSLSVPSITCTAPLTDSCTPFLTCAALLAHLHTAPHTFPNPSHISGHPPHLHGICSVTHTALLT